jgi:hypothetical protein
MKYFFLLAALISTYAIADVDYGPAIDAAKRAAMIQTGAQSFQDKLGSYAEGRAKYYIDQAGLTPVLEAGGGVWYVYKHREIPIKYHRVKLTLQPDCAKIELNASILFENWIK